MEETVNYHDAIKKLTEIYPHGIPPDVVIFVCQKIEINYLKRMIDDREKMNKLVKDMNGYIDKVKIFNTFSVN